MKALSLSSMAATLVTPSLTCGAGAPQSRPSVVRVVKTDSGCGLTRDGRPYFIKGGGGQTQLKALADAGGNSLRTWAAENLDPVLDEAQKLGLTVTVGIWLGHERHGFSYNNADQVAEQSEKARQAIMRYKDHPAVLMWGIGNEMEGYEKGDNAAIWSAVNNIAAMARRLDPNHPTMTVIAEIGGDRVKNIHRLCPDVDVVGINSYGGVASIARRYQEAGGVKPYVVTEFGPPGIWETGKNEWGAAPEPTSTEKAEIYRKAYEQAIASQKGQCLGSYVFAWGHKQEATATWFGMFLPDGSKLAAVDVMTELWSGKPPANRCPAIQSLKLEGPALVDPGTTVRASLAASDPEGEPLKVRWVLQKEPFSYGTGGDAEEVPPTYPDAIVSSDHKQAQVRMPKEGGGYRLFAYVQDGRGGAAVGNLPLRVKGPETIPDGRPAKLPLVLYDDAEGSAPTYVPAGWMGNVRAIKMDRAWTDRPHSGKTCVRVDYGEKENWGGVVWQHPEGDWGDRPGGWDLSGATRLSFCARGEKGDETVSFEFGLIRKEKRFFDTAAGKLEKVRLTRDWKQYSLDLKGKDLKRIKTGFAWVVAAEGAPVTFYLDDIRYE
jgi:glycosyl hydrolase family 2